MSDVKKVIFEGAIKHIKKEYVSSEEHNQIMVSEADMYTVYGMINSGIFRTLKSYGNKEKNTELNLNNLLIVGLDYDEDEQAENKVGNYVPYLRLGSKLAEILKIKGDKDKIKEKDFKEIWADVVKKAKLKKHISEENRTAEEMAYIIFESILVSSMEYIKDELKENDNVIVENGEYFTIEASKEDDEVSVLITAGPLAKLRIKDDEDSEDEE